MRTFYCFTYLFILGVFELPFASFPQFVGGFFERESEVTDCDCSDRSNQHAPVISRTGELPSREEDYVVTVAIIVGFGGAAYLVFKGKIP